MKNWSFGAKMPDYSNWPRNDDGTPVNPVFLERVFSTQLDAEININLLEAYGIPVVMRYPNDGEFGNVILGMSGTGVELFVPETLLEDARNILSGDIIEEDEQEDE